MLLSASRWVQRWSHLLAPGTPVLDLACGGGRHLAWFAQRGHPVTGVDRDLAGARAAVPEAALIEADIENAPWPLMQDGQPRPFGAVVVTNYLWRPLFPTLIASLAPGGALLYETFARGNETVGRPARSDFLLEPGELLSRCQGLDVVAYECGFLDHPARFVQRIVAVAPTPPVFTAGAPFAVPARYPL